MIATTGFFDGVHRGHRLVIERLVSLARERGDESLVVTFWPHPRAVLQDGARELRLLNTLEEKKQLLRGLGVDRIEVLDFTRPFAALTARAYLSLLRDRFGVTTLLMGYDNRVGSDRMTAAPLRTIAAEIGIELIELHPLAFRAEPEVPFSSRIEPAPLSFRAEPQAPFSSRIEPAPLSSRIEPAPLSSRIESEVPVSFRAEPQAPFSSRIEPAPSSSRIESASFSSRTEPQTESRNLQISSTMIRRALEEGDVAAAAEMLGYQYGLRGVVVAGNRLGRTIGFPTANMQLYEPLKLVPGKGVYVVEVEVLGRKFRGMTNIGTRPTVGGTTTSIETHILDFDEDIYGLPLQLRFLRRLRNEVHFPSLDALKAQLALDRTACRS